jgi:hypothetical protein
MRLTRHVTIGLAVAALAATGASAHGGPVKDKPKANAACRPAPVLLMGTLANDPAAGDTSFQLMVKRANRKGRAYVKAGNPVTVSVDGKTRIRENRRSASVDALSLDDRAVVLAKVCRAGTAPPALTARLVLAKSPHSPSGN